MKALGQQALHKTAPWPKLYLFSIGLVVVASLAWAGFFETLLGRPSGGNETTATDGSEALLSPSVIQGWWQSQRGKIFFWNVIWYAGMMFAIHVACRFVWIRFLSRESYYKHKSPDRFYLAEKVPSTIHGMICGAGSVYLIFFTDAFDNDVVKGYHSLCDWVCAVSFGYEVYDLVIMVLQKDFSIVFWTHHLSLCIGYILTVSYQRLAFVPGVMWLTELTVLPSNLHWYLKTFNLKDTRLFHFNQGLRLWSYIILRIPIPPYVWYHLYHDRERFFQEPLIARLAVYVLTSLLAMMNVYWTWMLIRLYRKRTPLKKKLELKRLQAEKLKSSSGADDKPKSQ